MKMTIALAALAAAILPVILPAAGGASPGMAGVYSNIGYSVQTVGRPASADRMNVNRLMPWLHLLQNGTYEWGRERGTYQVRANELRPSGSYSAWGPGRIDADRRVTFKFQRPDSAGRLQQFIVTMGYGGSLADYPPPSQR